MFRYGKQQGMRAVGALILALIPLLMVYVFLPQLGSEIPMKVSASGEVLRYGSMWDLLFVPALGFVLCGATIATGLKQAGKYVDEPNMAKITFARSVRNALVQNVVFIVATGIILYGAVSGHGIGF